MEPNGRTKKKARERERERGEAEGVWGDLVADRLSPAVFFVRPKQEAWELSEPNRQVSSKLCIVLLQYRSANTY